ncbi:MAG: hypothetical protein KDK55_04485, partial [Chlamydiia bacterium]|nr:hypothetical protein [Chlamydiia bacterium]
IFAINAKKNHAVFKNLLKLNPPEYIATLTEEFRTRYHLAEFVSYESYNDQWGEEGSPVLLVLQAAPAIGYMKDKNIETDELQKYAALANYTAIFSHAIQCAINKKKPVVVHLTSVGGGVFENKQQNIFWGLRQAGIFYQEQMKKLNIRVKYQVFTQQKDNKFLLKKFEELLNIESLPSCNQESL